jgi:hypothetical protein
MNYITKQSSIKIIFIFFTIANSFLFAQQDKIISLVNLSHIDHLYQKININGKEMGIIHIYSNYPDYKYADAADEGIACVDDIARADIFYMQYYRIKNDSAVYAKIKMLTNFILYMQAENGFFNNFIFPDYSKDKTYKTSVAQPNWWSWRAIWALAEANVFFTQYDASFAAEIFPQLKRAVNVTLQWLKEYTNDNTIKYGGYKLPAWLPFENASDQAAIIIKGFLVYYQLIHDSLVKKEIIRLCQGIEKMQQGDPSHKPYGAFLSWQNTWHLWGNNQAEALIEAGTILNEHSFICKAKNEIKHFYPYLINSNYMSGFTIELKNNCPVYKDSSKYDQIAYGISPMVLACIKYYNSTKDSSAAKLAGELACWFFGKNPTGKPMYDVNNGICFDGINSADKINMNSGAESTIEALFVMSAVDKNFIAKKIVMDYYRKHIKIKE